MSIEDVASQLHTYGLDRDARTIQRWCKSGKLDALIDGCNGDRWVIDPASVQSVIDDILVKMSRRPAAFSLVSRHGGVAVGDTATPPRQVSNTTSQSHAAQGDSRRDAEATPTNAATTSSEDDDTVATLKERVQQLEVELFAARADVKVRQEMVQYQREEFTKWLTQTIDQAETIGSLKRENQHLRMALPAAEPDGQGALEFPPVDDRDEGTGKESMKTFSYEPSDIHYPQRDHGHRAV